MPKDKSYKGKGVRDSVRGKSHSMGSSSSSGGKNAGGNTEEGTFFQDGIKTEGMGLDKEKNLDLYRD